MKKKKPKVYIPTYKIIITCGSIIVVCMALLLITNLVSINKAKAKDEASISQRYEQENKTDNKTANSKNNSNENKSTLSLEEVRNTAPKVTTTSNSKKADTSSRSDEKQSKAKAETAKPAATTTQKPEKKETVSVTPISTTSNTNSKSSTATNSTANTTSVSTSKPKTETTTAAKPKESTPSPASSKTAVTQATVVTTPTTTPSVTTNPAIQPAKKSDFGFPQAVNNAQLVFVFDDGGQNISHLDKFLKLPFPITIAVLPRLAHSKESAAKIRASGNELMLHQPMQALNVKVNPGPGAITPDMDENAIISTLFQNINEIGPIAGINNHEGSAITADAEKMSVILKTTSENGIFFLDSRTNVDTQVPYVAHELGYSYYERNVFLDNTKVRSDILKEINKGIALANKNGVVIMIGHIWSADVLPDILNEIYPELKQKGYTFTTVSKSKGKK